jgi:hypothetical protein
MFLKKREMELQDIETYSYGFYDRTVVQDWLVKSHLLMLRQKLIG